MIGRMERLGFLIKFINDNAALSKVRISRFLVCVCVFFSLTNCLLHRCHNLVGSAWLSTQKSCTLLTNCGCSTTNFWRKLLLCWFFVLSYLKHSLSINSSGHRRSILNEAVYAYMNDVGERHHEDFMRAFFRLSVRDVGELLGWIMHLLSRLERETANVQNMVPALCEANKATLVCQPSLSCGAWLMTSDRRY
jgi:hypothetical protein